MRSCFPRLSAAFLAFITCALATLAAVSPEPAAPHPLPSAADVRTAFAQPPVDDSSAPLWVWNDQLDETMVRTSLRDLARQNVRQAFVHPRPGLMTPYLSAEWFRLWRAALDEAKSLGMKLWIYDENSYPSGFAGGLVPDAMPESRGLGLAISEAAKPPAAQAETLAIYRVEGDAIENITTQVRAGTAPAGGRFFHATRVVARPGPWFGGKTYVNLLTPGVTDRFLELTLGAYRRELGAELGRTVPGAFTDEPHLRPAPGSPWCDDLPERFRARWGYDPLAVLPSLSAEVGDWRRVRHNYLQLLNELFVERWGKPYFDYCAAHGLQATGHYWEHEWPNCRSVPDNMTMYAWQHRPGIDTLMNQYADTPNAQFGNARAVRELASVANQLGRPRTLCELYGAGGWDLRFEDMKRIGDWLQVLGVNFFSEHLSYVSIRGGRKRDHPQSFSYHEPWWDAYHVPATYFSRITAALTAGEQRNDVLLLEPTSSAWMYNYGRQTSAPLAALGVAFQDTVNAFEAAQIEYDIGSEHLLAQHGSVGGRQLLVGRRAYEVVVIPAGTENLNMPTLELLERYLRAGGTVLCLGEPPTRVDGAASARATQLAGWKPPTRDEAIQSLGARTAGRFAIERAPGDRGLLFHHRRRLADGDILFLVNTSIEHTATGTVRAVANRVEQWDAETGEVRAYPAHKEGSTSRAEFTLPPCGSLLLHLARTSGSSPAAPARASDESLATDIAAKDAITVTRLEPNVLTLDTVDVTAGGETLKSAYAYAAAQFVFRQNGVGGNPWESSVQFRDELLKQTFPATSGFEATYRFTVVDTVPADLEIVIERPDLYRITCNGQPVAAPDKGWWLDRAFGRVPLGGAARVGENTVTLVASPMTTLHELEPAYVRGTFRVAAGDTGVVLAPDTPLALGAWSAQGQAFYPGAVRYRQTFSIAAPRGRYQIELGAWRGSVAKVVVNGFDSGVIGWSPWRCDVTPSMRAGENTIDVIVIGTLKNLLGPHHGKPQAGRAWPAEFRVAPKTTPVRLQDYSVIEYGLFEPFRLRRL